MKKYLLITGQSLLENTPIQYPRRRTILPQLMGILLTSLLMNPEPVSAVNGPDSGLIRQTVNYQVPDLSVIKPDGSEHSFLQEIDDGRPVIMSFIFTTCSAICPMLGHTLMKVQSKLTEHQQTAHLVSITIDPENDTPSTLADYAKKLSAGPNWDFYTGTRDVSISLQKAFNVYRGDKMNHASVILIRSKPNAPWIRLEGFINSDQVISELQPH